MDKKAFQKFVKQFRKEGEKFPKAMMFGSQVRKGQATINCGYSHKSEGRVQEIINSGLEEFLKEYGATYEVERRLTEREDVVSQIRIYY